MLLPALLAAASAGAVSVSTSPTQLGEAVVRAGGGMIVLQAGAGERFVIAALQPALPAVFSCGGSCTELRGFMQRSRVLLSAGFTCDCSCGAQCSCGGGTCSRAVVHLAADAEYDIGADETVLVDVPSHALQGGSGGSSGRFTVSVSPGVLSVKDPHTGALSSTVQLTGEELAAGTPLELWLEGETWRLPFMLSALRSNVSAADEPRGFEARKRRLITAATVGPANVLRLPFQTDGGYGPSSAERISICGDAATQTLLSTSRQPFTAGASLQIVAPFSSGCARPRTTDCLDCTEGYYGIDCARCPVDSSGSTCSGHGECRGMPAAGSCAGSCPAPRCDQGCSAGMGGAGSCVCAAGWEGMSCQSRMAIATAATAASGAATGSILLELAAGGSPAAPLTGLTQMQIMVLLGIQSCAPDELRGLASGPTWVLHPMYGEIQTGHGPFPDDARHLREAVSVIVALFAVHVAVVAGIFLALRRQGWTLRNAQEKAIFPGLQLLSCGLFLCSAVSSSAAVLSRPWDHDNDVVFGAALAMVGFAVVMPAMLLYYYARVMGACGEGCGGGPVRAEYLSRNVANSGANAVRVIYTTERAAKMPATLVRFLPSGFWTSLHLPDRGFCGRFGILFDEFHSGAYYFMLVQTVKLVVYATTLGVREPEEGCNTKLVVMCFFFGLFAVAITLVCPYSSIGSNVLQSLVAWCNFLVLLSVVLHETGSTDRSYAHIFLFFNTGVLITLALWNMLVFLLGKTVYKVERVGHGKGPERGDKQDATVPASPLHEIGSDLESTPAPATTPTEDLSLLLGCAATHVGEADLCLGSGRGYNRRWLELRETNLFFFESPDDSEQPKGWIELGNCELKSSKDKVVLSAVRSREVYTLRCENEAEAETWACALQQFVAGGPVLRGDGPEFSDATLDSYAELEVLGIGSFGEVRRVRCIASGREFAMKKLHVSGADLDAVLNEIAILQLLRHPNVVRLEVAFRDGPNTFLVMQLLPGGDLAEHIKLLGSLPTDAARYYSAQVTLALEHLHANSVLYRDLKPANIVLDGRGDAVLTDMGVAKRGLSAGDFCGTPLYLAPEVVQYSAYTHAVDWWAFGVVLFEMLVGVTPFAGAELQITFQLIQTADPVYPPLLPRSAVALISQLLAKRPSERLTNPKLVRQGDFFRGLSWDKLSERRLAPPRLAPTRTSRVSVSAGGSTPRKQVEPLRNPIDTVFGAPRAVDALHSTRIS